MKNPLISVIIPVFNGEKYIAEAIQSVLNQKSVLNQNYEPLEILVIDDGSTDETASVVKSIDANINYFYQNNQGVAMARNTGLKNTKGDFITFIDSDDLWPANKLSIQLARFSGKPHLEIVQGYIRRFISPNSPTPPNFIIGKDDAPVFALHLGAGVFKKSVFKKIGLMDGNMKYAEDIDWFLRAIENQVSISVSDEIVYFYRAHQSNMTHNTNQTNLYMLKACKKSLDRRRKANPENPKPLPNIKNPDELIKLLND